MTGWWRRGRRRFATVPPPAPEAVVDADQAWKVLTLVNDWLRHGETKLATILTATGVSGGALFNLVSHHRDGSLAYNASAVTCFVGVLGAAVCAVCGLFPQLALVNSARQLFLQLKETQEADWKPPNPIYFHDIAHTYPVGPSGYVPILQGLTTTPEDLVGHIAQQVQSNSTVAQRKYRWAGRAMRFLSIALVGLVALATVIALKLW